MKVIHSDIQELYYLSYVHREYDPERFNPDYGFKKKIDIFYSISLEELMDKINGMIKEHNLKDNKPMDLLTEISVGEQIKFKRFYCKENEIKKDKFIILDISKVNKYRKEIYFKLH